MLVICTAPCFTWRNFPGVSGPGTGALKEACKPLYGPSGNPGDPGLPGFPGLVGMKGEPGLKSDKPQAGEDCYCPSGPPGDKGIVPSNCFLVLPNLTII